jgi:MFS family permease
VQILPYFLLFLPAGHAADRFDRKGITQTMTLLYMAASVGFGWASLTHPEPSERYLYLLFGLLFGVGIANAFYTPAKNAMLPHLVPSPSLENAVTWNSGSFQAACIAGPLLGGFLIAGLGCTAVYFLDAFLSLSAFSLLAWITYRGQEQDRKAPGWSSLMEGARFVRRTKPILATLTLDLFAVLLGGCTALLPIFVKDILGEDAKILGVLHSSAFVGALCMALVMSRFPLKRPGVAMLWSVAGFGAATIAFGLSKALWLSIAMMFLIGALDIVSVIVRGTLVQVLTPGRLLGRVQSVNYLFINASNELGAFESGVAAALLGPVGAVVLGGTVAVGFTVWVHRKWPEVAKLGPLRRRRS